MRATTHSHAVHLLAAVIVATVLVAAAHVESTRGAPAAATGTLAMNATLGLRSTLGACPPRPDGTDCAARTIRGPFPGLGRVSGSYEFHLSQGPPRCAEGFGKALAYPIRFTVAGKGEIHVAVAEADCVDVESIRTQTQTFTVTGGTGAYAGASGSGTLERVLGSVTSTGRSGHEAWKGTLVVPGIATFDVTQPTISGAVNRTVRAPRRARSVQVRFSVTAQDAVDGAVPVACAPRSGSRFRVGRTRVTCSATDTSGNTATARFAIRVTPRR